MKNKIIVGVVCCMAVIGSLLIASCTGKISKEPAFGVRCAVVVGTVQLVREKQKPRDIPIGEELKQGDMIILADESKIKFIIGDDDAAYVLGPAKVQVSSLVSQTTDTQKQSLTFTLIFGEIYSSLKKMTAQSSPYMVATPTAVASIRGTHFSVSFDAATQVSEVKTLTGEVMVKALETSQESAVSADNKIRIEQNGSMGSLQQIIPEDVDHLKNWVGESEIDAVAKSPIVVATAAPEPLIDSVVAADTVEPPKPQTKTNSNKAPNWIGSGIADWYVGAELIDTLRAQDPEGGVVQYKLVKGPKGLTIDQQTGIVTFVPVKAGNFDVNIKVFDEDQKSSDLRYTIKVKDGLTVTLDAPENAAIGQSVTLSAAGSRDQPAGSEDLQFRFDVDGDGKWDYPTTGYQSEPSIAHVFTNAGMFSVSVEVKNPRGRILGAARRVSVSIPGFAKATATPQIGTIGTEFVFESQQNPARSGDDKSQVRWDFGADGSWDMPGGSAFSAERSVRQAFDAVGTYKVVLETKNESNEVAFDTVSVMVNKGIVAAGIDGSESGHIGDTLLFTCKAEDKEFPITDFTWSLDSDPKGVTKTTVPTFKKFFPKAGVFKVGCTVTNQKKQTVTVVKTVTIVNSGTVVKAGGPYTTKRNYPVTFKGTFSDPDNKVLQYSWNFTGAAKDEFTSATSASTKWVFSRVGAVKVVFKVKTDDNVITADTAIVTVTGKPPKAVAGADLVSERGRMIRLPGKGVSDDGTIVKYEWDFEGDGKFDWSSTDEGSVEHKFDVYSYPVLKVTDADGMTAIDTVRVVVCPEGMQTIKDKKYCIDYFEFPNKRDVLPQNNISYEDAQQKCKGVGKRLCTAEEWQFACASRENRNYPYGNDFGTEECNTLGNKYRYNQIAKAGEFDRCVSPFDVYDMSGNVAEWVQDDLTGIFGAFGGSWQTDQKASKCISRVSLYRSKKYFYVGARCCK